MNKLYWVFLLVFLFNCKVKQNKQHLDYELSGFNNQLIPQSWTPIGPFGSPTPVVQKGEMSPHGNGRFMCVNVHPYLNNEILIGHATSGLFKTTDGGKTWQQKLKFEWATGIFKIIRFDEDPMHLIAATGMDIGNSRQYGFGLIESFDGGETWQRNALQFNPEEYKLVQSRDVAILKSSHENQLLSITQNKIFTTQNKGKNWESVFETKYDLKQIQVNDFNSNQIAVIGSGFLFSENSGKNWSDLSAYFNVKGKIPQRFSVVFSKKHKNKLYVFTQDGQNHLFEGFLGDWNNFKLINSSTSISNRSRQTVTSFFDTDLETEFLYIGTIRLSRSIDDGLRFKIITSPNFGDLNHTHDDINQVVFKNNTLYCATDGGVDISYDFGNSWQSLTNHSSQLNTAMIFGFDLSKKGILMCGTQDNGIFVLQNSSWSCLDMYGDGGRAIAVNDSAGFASGFAQSSFLTLNKGKNFYYLHPSDERTGFDFKMYYHQKMKLLFVANMNLYQIDPLIKNKAINLTKDLKSDRHIKAFWVNPNNENEIWIGRDDPTWGTELKNKLLKTDDGGQTWTDFTPNLPALMWRSITDIVINEFGNIGITIDGFDNNNSEFAKFYYSEDGGLTFINSSKGLPNLPNNCLININNQWICGNNASVYILENGVWKPLGNNFPPTIVTELKYFKESRTLIASTFGRGMWAIKI